MSLTAAELALYRPNVGIMLLNHDRRVFVGRRIDMPAGLAAWQMPQGGIDPGETPAQAALRELREEIGTDRAEILGETEGWHHYDLPPEIAGRMWRGRFRGQRQKWFAMRFTGSDTDIDLATEHPEFDAWEWVAPERLPEMIVPFKRALYRDVLHELRPYWVPPQGAA
ncbi:MAG TPA: RNA pyrophosphohydrolase [Stellaceae bacterium]|jgi:putative (di)nucleoside polyphosphate hydrolase|nr:RNA pyrophosphohydrolase [Stellaceae bacterium]